MPKAPARRPDLSPRLAAADFRSFYWRKDELARFCRRRGLPVEGSKAELTARIVRFLETGQMPQRKTSRRCGRSVCVMPPELCRETVLGPGWRCGEKLRAFFVREIGPQFHFNQSMRDFVRHGAGRILQEGIDIWKAANKVPRGKTIIAPQFEYNRHMREFFRANPGKSLRQAIAAWRKNKGRRRAD